MEMLVFWELMLILGLIAANGFFSGAEIAVISANRVRLREWADRGDRRAQTALELAHNPNRFLPTVQVGITLIGTFAAVFGGATIAEAFGTRLRGVPVDFIASRHKEISLAIVVVGITFASVVLGELVPKRLALHNPTRIARFVARPLDMLSRAARPVVWCLGAATNTLTWLCGVRAGTAEGISLQEIRRLIELGTAQGVVDPMERQLAFEALHLGDRTVHQIMKPRIDIHAVPLQIPPDELLRDLSVTGFTRLPVYERNLDHIVGFIHLKDVLRQHYLGWQQELKDLILPALVVPETMRLDQLMVRFQKERNQLAIVVDEFGATRGMVTLEDVVEEIVGELLTEHHERVEQQIVARAEGGWLVDGGVSIADLLERLGRENLLDSAPRNVSSVAGLLLERLGRLPKVGEAIDWHDLRLEVVDLDGRRIDRVLVTLHTS